MIIIIFSNQKRPYLLDNVIVQNSDKGTNDSRIKEFLPTKIQRLYNISTAQFPIVFFNEDINKQSKLASAATANQIIQNIEFVLKAVSKSFIGVSE